MARKYVDCREMPSESKCTVAIYADSEKELIEVAVQHAVKVHGHQDTAEFRQMLKQAIKEGSPPPELREQWLTFPFWVAGSVDRRRGSGGLGSNGTENRVKRRAFS